MLVKGNNKLGKEIYLFNLPSARKKICKWMTRTCKKLCYDARQEKYRPTIHQARFKNYELSKREDFPQMMMALIHYLKVKLLRLHGGGELYSVAYAKKWLLIMKACSYTRFYFYTRAWRDPQMAGVLEQMARLKNVRVWYSLDRDTGTPARVPRRVRLAYLQANPADRPPAGVHLVFRPAEMRRKPQTRVDGIRVCPSENGVQYREKVHCGNCNICHREMPVSSTRGLLSLPVFPA